MIDERERGEVVIMVMGELWFLWEGGGGGGGYENEWDCASGSGRCGGGG